MISYKFKVMTCGSPNQGLIYPKKEMERVLEEARTRIESRMLFVTFDAYKMIGGVPPDPSTVDLSKVCGYLTSYTFKDNDLYAEVGFLPKDLRNKNYPSNKALTMLEVNEDSLKLNPIGLGIKENGNEVTNYSLVCFNLVPK